MDARCTWCGTGLDPSSSWTAGEPAGARRAAFCRLEHVVPWAIQGPHWEAGDASDLDVLLPADARCGQCDGPLPDTRVVLVHHRGEYRVADGFCGTEHLLAWARAGGRWAR